MPKVCFVAGCNSNYRSCKERVSIFGAPKDEEQLKKWAKAIRRTDRKLGPKDSVCAKHFPEWQVMRERKVIHEGKVILRYAISPKLLDDAVPSIFPNRPAYMSKPAKPLRKPPKIRAKPPPKVAKQNGKSRRNIEENVLEDGNCATSSSNVEEVTSAVEEQSVKTPEEMFNDLKMIVSELKLMNESWAVHVNSINSPQFISVSQMKVNPEMKPYVGKQMLITQDMQLRFFINQTLLDMSTVIPDGYMLQSVKDLQNLLELFTSQQECVGGPKFSWYRKARPKKAFVDVTGHWRHSDCTLLTFCPGSCCKRCLRVEAVLRTNMKRASLEIRKV